MDKTNSTVVKEVKLTKKEQKFFKFNDHLTPVMRLSNRALIVKDVISDEWGERIAYVMAPFKTGFTIQSCNQYFGRM